MLKNSIVKICKIASIVRFNTTKTDQELIFQQLYYKKQISSKQFTCPTTIFTLLNSRKPNIKAIV
ncbi:hypothetical protein AMR47_06000 [Leptospira interrogans]|nr:hypothetical protein AMR47_06000 [Leptospira interrogans]